MMKSAIEEAHLAMMRRYLSLIAVIAVAGCAGESVTRTGCVAGLLITNATIVDGSGAPPVAGSVRVVNGSIAAIGELDRCDGDTVVDAHGQALAPGFIDTHSHAEEKIFEQPDALPIISQGITTVVAGQDGESPYPLAEFYVKLEESPATISFAAYVGHNTLRELVLRDDFRREATAAEIEEMQALLTDELDSGAIGLSAGLEYEPGIHSSTDEIVALARIAAAAGGRYASHVRSEDRWFEEAVEESILIGRETGMPVHVSHIKLAMTRLWGTAPQTLEKLDAARAEGIDITADIYPYEYWQSSIMVLLPDRDPTDRAVIADALEQIAPADSIRMTKFEPDPDYVGKTLTEIAALREIDAITAFTQIAEEALAWKREHGSDGEMIIGTSMLKSDIDELMSWPYTNICTDGGIVDRHPRARGSFPRVLGRFARQEGLMPLAEVVRKMTSLPAASMGFFDRGLIREGMVADLVLFDPDSIIDHATALEPERLSTGVTKVWVSGELVYEEGAATGARPGTVIRR
jgi:N-acyl-D-amino-acid deacylase